MDSLSEQDKAEAREEFENQLRYAFIQYDGHDDEEEPTEVGLSYINSRLNKSTNI